MAWKMVDVDQQRVRFVVAASRQEKPLRQLCQEFGISRPTGYVWLERYQQYGLAGMEEQSRRPHSSPGRTVAEREQQVIQLRQRYPDWGARKLQVLLAQQGLALPASTIHRILLRASPGAGRRPARARGRSRSENCLRAPQEFAPTCLDIDKLIHAA
jgi:transposase